MSINYLPDIYNISQTIQEIQKKYMEEDDTTLMLGIYGYLNETFSNVLQNAIYVASEYGNEAIPVRSKYERTILTNAITYDIEDINAQPAKMTVMIGFEKNSIDKYIDNNGTFVLDRYSDISIEEYKFHLDYDLEIRRNKLMNGSIVYTAKYNMDFENNISDLENPYLQSPIVTNINGDDYIFIICTIRQTFFELVSNKVITNNILESKTFDFTFENQLCSFNIYAIENDKTIELTPVYEGMPYDKSNNYCYYTYINDNKIRIKFDRNSYQPGLNSEINIEIYTTLGNNGNFEYSELLLLPLSSTKYDYKNIKAIIKPMTSSTNGVDKKTPEELQKIIPKRMLSRGAIINTKDLQNYFDMIDVDNRLVVFKKRDNQIERLYYAYLIAKDSDNNVVPTNTIDININSDEFDIFEDERYILGPGKTIYYDKEMIGYYKEGIIKDDENLEECGHGYGCLVGERHPVFQYSSPFIMALNKDPLSISYYLDLINREYVFSYDYINQKSILQFVSTKISLYKNYLVDDDYVLTMNITQNMSNDESVITYVLDEDGKETDEIDEIRLKPVLVVTSGKSKYYTIGEVIDYDKGSTSFTLQFKIKPIKNMINRKNQLKVSNLILNGQSVEEDIYINNTVNLSVYTFVSKEVSDVFEDELYNSDVVVPELSDYILTNKYIIKEDVKLLYNYSSTINSVAKIINSEPDKVGQPDENGIYHFELYSIPLIKEGYINDEMRLDEFIEYLQYRKTYIDMAQYRMEDSFNVDLKFFNTYGPSKLFHIGRQGDVSLDKVNITLNFTIKLNNISDIEIIPNIRDDIKLYIEDINTMDSIHMSNICTKIKSDYSEDINYIEFDGMNSYNANYQYIERQEPDILSEVPEFITVNLTDDIEPDINITIL